MESIQNILIADSGSTKTAWTFSDGKVSKQFTTGGANPFFRNTADLTEEWKESPVHGFRGRISHLFFYAAGVVNDEKAGIIEKALRFFFPEAIISIRTDLLAAARATLGNREGIACILGTGSNSCQYDGEKITEQVPPLGFILGDEGSGAVMGKQLVGDYLKKIMPSELRQSFSKFCALDYNGLLDRVYLHEKPNMFLASLAPFLKENIHHPYCSGLAENAFDLFITRNITQYTDYPDKIIGVVGSVAWHFREQMEKVFLKRNLRLGKVVKEPMPGLVEYHLQHLLP